MRILIEEYQYEAASVRDVLYGVDALQNVEGAVSLSYVGYFYNPKIKDCVFILPKVLMNEANLVFGKYSPTSIIHLDESKLEDTEQKFLYEFAVWIYRAVDVYHRSHKDSEIVYHRQISQVGRGMRRRTNTLLDILLSLIQFNKDNQNYITFILKNIHSGYNKINWTRTISHEQAYIQDEAPIYLRVANKKRKINFDEELLIIYYSILNHISETYGFSVNINIGFPLIKGAKFKSYLDGRGVIRLRQIKYKYFSDKALELWNLCYAFFAHRTEITTSAELKEYLLVKNFYIVFEAIIDKLIGDSKDDLPTELTEQKDGKLVDHLYTYPGLIEADDNQRTYYIGDSKYYKIGGKLGETSIYKQYTYARNIVQYNIDLWLNRKPSDPEPEVRLRDDITEGYNVIPNFFISAAMKQGDFSYGHREIELTKSNREQPNPDIKFQFKDRLFDRDTMLLSRYNVNFLFVIGLYARHSQAEMAKWKEEVRAEFRKHIRQVLSDKFSFYPMRSKGVDLNEYMTAHFRELIGKVFTPFEDKNIVSLALQKTDDLQLRLQQEELLAMLEKDFDIDRKYTLGEEPNLPAPKAILFGMQDTIIVGYYRDEKQLDWIQSIKVYNVRVGNTRGTMEISPEMIGAKYLFLYGPQGQFKYHLAQRSPVIWSKEDIKKQGYENPKHDFYFIFHIDKPVSEGDLATMEIDVKKIENALRERGKFNVAYNKDPMAITMTEFVNCAKDNNQPIVEPTPAPQPQTKQTSDHIGYCIRCGAEIDYAYGQYRPRFYCKNCWRDWYNNDNCDPDKIEHFCHRCGKPLPSSYNNPIHQPNCD